MKRTFLLELGLENEIVDKIMAEHGKTLSREKSKLEAEITELNDDLTSKKDELKTVQKDLKKFEGIDVEALTQESNDWKAKYENLQSENMINDFFKDVKFTSNLARKATIDEFKNQKFEIEDGKFKGADEYLKKIQEENKDAFIIEDTDNKVSEVKGYSYKPASGDSQTSDVFTNQLNNILGIKGE